jgi:glutamyl-tRNA synthetase
MAIATKDPEGGPPVRVRYAPSPTGLQHIGGLRTALFNYLFARSRGGAFILRLEDTDRTRFDESYVRNLYDTFNWLGLRWDEGPDRGGAAGPYVQSERLDMYRRCAAELLRLGKASYCFCSSERLDRIRAEREAAHSPETGYDRRCRDIPPEEGEKRAGAGEPHTIRLKIPLGERTRFRDYLSGEIEWKNEDVNPDPVLLKSDGFPTYHLANVVDDHLMGISHVLRAQEWLPSTPLHVIMYRSFGWEHPEYCHLPMVMGQDGKKLSKRHGAVSVDEFRRQGYLPEALINYVALLGCSYEEGRDLYTLEELSSLFSLDRLNKAPAAFDYKKLEWFNGQYIRMKSDEELARLSLPLALEQGLFGPALTDGPAREGAAPESALPSEEDRKRYTEAMGLVKERAVLLREIPEKLGYLFSDPPLPEAEEFFPKKSGREETAALLRMGLELVRPLAEAPGDGEAETRIKAFAEERGIKLGDLMMPLRVALTGARVSPPLFGSLRLLGAEKSLKRVERALALLEGSGP